MIRLADLDPAAVAQDAAGLLARRVERLAWQLQPTGRLDLPAGDIEWGATQIGPLAHDLCRYAQHGGDPGEAYEGLITVAEVLWSRPIDADGAGMPDPYDSPDTPLAIATAGALARYQLDTGEAITARALGLLAGLTADMIRKLTAAGELSSEGLRPATYDAAQCRRWLASRGVRGF